MLSQLESSPSFHTWSESSGDGAAQDGGREGVEGQSPAMAEEEDSAAAETRLVEGTAALAETEEAGAAAAILASTAASATATVTAAVAAVTAAAAAEVAAQEIEAFPRGISLVFAWGSGEDGQLGTGSEKDEQSPQLIPALLDRHVVAVVGGSRNSLALTASGQVFLWGWNQRSTLGHSFEEKSQPRESKPAPVSALKSEHVVQAAVGGWHVIAVTNRGTAFAWGGNEYGQCAFKSDKALRNRSSARDIPLPITCVPHLRVRQVAAGGMHSLVLTEQGEVWTWGQPWPPANNKQGWVPMRVQGLSNVAAIVAGAFHNVALEEGGTVWSWGDNEYGQLGSGSTQPRSAPQPILELDDLEVVDIAASGWHTMAVTASGQLWTWGRGEHGRLGLGDDKASKLVPVQVAALAKETIVQVSCGGTHSVALTLDGRMYAFGRRDNGRLGPLGQVTTGHPTRVPLPGDPLCADLASLEEGAQYPDAARAAEHHPSFPLRTTQVSCGGRHTLALVCHKDDLLERRARVRWHQAANSSRFTAEATGNVLSTALDVDTAGPQSLAGGG